MNTYDYPEIFVKNEGSDKYICKVNSETYVLTEKCLSRECFGHIIYEEILNYFDINNPILKEDVIVIPEFSDKPLLEGLLINRGTELCLVEISGYEPYMTVKEGEMIDLNDRVGLIITNKYEIRTVKSPCKGVVVFVINIVWEKPEKYIVVVVRGNDARKILIRKNKAGRI